MRNNHSKSKQILIISCVFCIFYFIVNIFPNKAGSENIAMVELFEPDESVPYPYILDMIKPANTFKDAIKNFAFYDYYFYGYPVFGLSALLLLPIKWIGSIENIPITLMILRQMISVFPMILTILILVYWRTEYKDYRSIILLLLLFSIPAVVQNNFWWHPDSLAILFVVLVLFFLSSDKLKFGKNFYLAAIFCGFSAGTKAIGFYFFFTIFIVLLLGLLSKKISFGKFFISAFGFLFVMSAAYLFSNPILIYEGVRTRFFQVMLEQSRFLSKGYEVAYAKGLSAALPQLKEFFGNIPFLLTIFTINILGLLRKKKRFDHILILSWSIPLSVMVFFISHFKFQYWIPVFLPLASTIGLFLPTKQDIKNGLNILNKNQRWFLLLKFLLLGLVIVQITIFFISDIHRYTDQLARSENNPAIQFYGTILDVLEDRVDDRLYVYHDVRMYVPPTGDWTTESVFEMLSYSFIQTRGFDVLLLLQSRIDDYTNPDLIAIDQEKLDLAQEFYEDVDQEILSGYGLLFRNDFGLIFVRDGLIHP